MMILNQLRIKYTVGVWIFSLCFILGCRKDETNFRPYEGAVEELVASIKASTSATNKTVFKLAKPKNDTILVSARGTRIFLTDIDALFSNELGQTVACSSCENLSVELVEFPKKIDWIAEGFSTVTEDGLAFDAGAMLYLQVTCDGNTLRLLDNRTLKIQYPVNAGVDLYPDFSILYGGTNKGAGPVWAALPTVAYQANWPGSNGTQQAGYELNTKKTGWVSCGKTFDAPSLDYCVELPALYSDKSTAVYAAFVKNNTIVKLIPDADQIGKFCASNIPTGGYQIRIVTFSKFETAYWLGQKLTETNLTGLPMSTSLSPVTSDQVSIVNFLKGL